MLLIPSSLQNTGLPPEGKRFVQMLQNRLSDDYIGIDGINITGVTETAVLPGDYYFAILSAKGLLLISFPHQGFLLSLTTMEILKKQFQESRERFKERLFTHSVLHNHNGSLLFPVRLMFVFPDSPLENLPEELKEQPFVKKNYRFKDWAAEVRRSGDADNEFQRLMSDSSLPLDKGFSQISDDMRDVIMNRIAPWATIPKITDADIAQAKRLAKADPHLKSVEIDKNESMVEVLRLDKNQLDEVNAINNGHQLILACAGSGKSVILIAKCFKMASLDKNRKFLIVCYNRNLIEYYKWQVDEAGFNNRNVKCCTFHQLCRDLLLKYKIPLPYVGNDAEGWNEYAERTIQGIKQGVIKDRFYGIFIDEVQIFDPRWYRTVYMLLESPESDNHILTLCGDMTQNLKKNVKRGDAPWQGQGLPIFKGRTIHIEINYRNSVQINRFVNIYSEHIRAKLPSNLSLQMNTYLRGTAFREGANPLVLHYKANNNQAAECEVDRIYDAINYMHDVQMIGYSEIAVLLYNGSGKHGRFKRGFAVKSRLENKLRLNNIPFSLLSWDDVVPYSQREGVSLLTYEGSLGLDFKGIIVAAVPLIGSRLGVCQDTLEEISQRTPELQEEYYVGFDALYLACTRAKDSLAIVLPYRGTEPCSVYTEAVENCIEEYNCLGEGSVVEL